jgi:hypothetical protein
LPRPKKLKEAQRSSKKALRPKKGVFFWQNACAPRPAAAKAPAKRPTGRPGSKPHPKLQKVKQNMARAESMVAFIAQLRTHAAINQGTEWDLLPPDDSIVADLIGNGRKMNRIIEGVGRKLSVLRSQGGIENADWSVLAAMGYDELLAHPANRAAAGLAQIADANDPVAKLIAAAKASGDNVVALPPPPAPIEASVVDAPVETKTEEVTEEAKEEVVELPSIFSAIRDQVEETETKRPRRR